MNLQKFFSTTILLTFLSILQAQSGKIYGTITDAVTNEALIGATVAVQNSSLGTVTDIDGFYALSLVPGKYQLEISYTGYQPQQITDLEIKGGENLKFDFALGAQMEIIETVVVTASAKRNSVSNLMILQQKSPGIVTGISADQMKLSPDRNTGDVLKRVSGASVQENKYVVIRGLADRYNSAMLNGLSLPSTEPDKRAFSFDVFPSNLLDNLIIYKTATPDLPGEFAGGIVQLNTKEIPQESFVNLTLSTGFNSQSSFKAYQSYPGGNSDWLGKDDGTRAVPSAVENIDRNTFNATTESQVNYAKAFPNNWTVIDESSMRPSLGMQLSAGKSFGNLGVIGGVSYNNSPRIVKDERGDFTGAEFMREYQYYNTIYKTGTALGALFNVAWKPSDRSKIQLNNTLTINGNNQLGVRTGDQLDQGRSVRAYSYYFTSDQLLSSQIIGEHALTNRQIKLNWAASYNRSTRDIPSYRRIWYYKNYDASAEDPYFASVPYGNPSPNFAGNFYAGLTEDFLAGKFDVTLPYFMGGNKGNLKFGGLAERKDREFDARLFGFISSFQTPLENLTLPIEQLFDAKNIGEQGFRMKETTNPTDSYTGNSMLLAGFAMAEQSLTERLRFIGGARFEPFEQELGAADTSFTRKSTDILPSLHLIYALSEKTNLRASAAKTVSRPTFRELVEFAFYDFFLEREIIGNPNLKRSQIWNMDLRIETYPGDAKYFAVSLFYKNFKDPIEQYQVPGTNSLTWQNADGAFDLGIEVEGRWKLGALAPALSNFTVFGNLSYIYSDVELKGAGQLKRPLYGQSPYLINGGLNYSHPELGFTATALFNQIGRRVWLVGLDQDPHVWEAPRSVLDFQVTKKIANNGEFKLTFGDVLNQGAVFYQDINENDKYDEGSDPKIAGQKFGSNISLGFSYGLSGR